MKRLLLAFWLTALATTASAQTCVVNDPTGTPLNVRTHPNGPILGALHNGAALRVLQAIPDAEGRPWAYIAPIGPGKRGWVFGAFLRCER